MKIITISREFGSGGRDAYHLTINTSDWNIKDFAPAVVDFANSWFGRKS